MLFLVTNFIVTDKQVQGTCPEVSRPCWGAVWEELGTVVSHSAVVCGMAQLPKGCGRNLELPELREHWELMRRGVRWALDLKDVCSHLCHRCFALQEGWLCFLAAVHGCAAAEESAVVSDKDEE